MEQWMKKIEDVFNDYDDNNPTTQSLLYMLNRMMEELKAYKEIGTVEEFRELKNNKN